MMLPELLIGISGGTGSGKSAIAAMLAERFAPMGVEILKQDSYYVDWSTRTIAHRAQVNYDEPAALDLESLATHLRALRAGTAVTVPEYVFATHTRAATGHNVQPVPFVIVEGCLIFHPPYLRDCLDFKVFVDTPADIRLARRLIRDTRDRGRTMESVLTQYTETVRHMHNRYVEPTRHCADLVVSNDGHLEDTVDTIDAEIKTTLSRRGHAADPILHLEENEEKLCLDARRCMARPTGSDA